MYMAAYNFLIALFLPCFLPACFSDDLSDSSLFDIRGPSHLQPPIIPASDSVSHHWDLQQHIGLCRHSSEATEYGSCQFVKPAALKFGTQRHFSAHNDQSPYAQNTKPLSLGSILGAGWRRKSPCQSAPVYLNSITALKLSSWVSNEYIRSTSSNIVVSFQENSSRSNRSIA